MTNEIGSPAPQFVTELLKAEAEGLYTELEVYAELMRQLDADNVDPAIAALPFGLHERFVAWARENYDNDIEPSKFLFIGGEGCLPTPDEAFAALRDWLRRHRGEAR
jgi:hypothetical protein